MPAADVNTDLSADVTTDPTDGSAPAGGSELARLAGAAIDTAADPGQDRSAAAKSLAALVPALARSAKAAGVGAVSGGRWLTDVVLDIAPHLAIRDAATLRAHYPGRSDAQIAESILRNAAATTAALGAAAGALAAVEFVAPPTLLAVPVQLAAHLIAVTAVEIKLVAELHEIAGARSAGGLMDRTGGYVLSWAQRRSVSTVVGVKGHMALGPMLGEAARRQIQSQLLGRLGRSTTTLAPMLLGAFAGAEINRRTTNAVGRRLMRDLRL